MQIANKNTEILLNWHDAILYCEFLGGNYRLPNKDELYAIYQTDNDFELSWYWTSTEYDERYAYDMHFKKGFIDKYGNKTFKHLVRAICS